jgi:hypothetical protein
VPSRLSTFAVVTSGVATMTSIRRFGRAERVIINFHRQHGRRTGRISMRLLSRPSLAHAWTDPARAGLQHWGNLLLSNIVEIGTG